MLHLCGQTIPKMVVRCGRCCYDLCDPEDDDLELDLCDPEDDDLELDLCDPEDDDLDLDLCGPEDVTSKPYCCDLEERQL